MDHTNYPYNLLTEVFRSYGDLDTLHLKSAKEELNRLPDQYRFYVKLRYIEGLNRKQCGKRMLLSDYKIEQLEIQLHRLLRDKLDDGLLTGVQQADYDHAAARCNELTQETVALRQLVKDIADGRVKPEDLNVTKPKTQPTRSAVPAELLVPIEDLYLSTRAYRALKQNRWDTLYAITQHTRKELRELRNVGPRVEREITALLLQRGLSFLGGPVEPSKKQGYPYNLIRAIYNEDKDDDTHVDRVDTVGLEKAIRTLSDIERTLLKSRFQDESILKVCAEPLGITPGKARQVIDRGVRKMRHGSRKKHYEIN